MKTLIAILALLLSSNCHAIGGAATGIGGEAAPIISLSSPTASGAWSFTNPGNVFVGDGSGLTGIVAGVAANSTPTWSGSHTFLHPVVLSTPLAVGSGGTGQSDGTLRGNTGGNISLDFLNRTSHDASNVLSQDWHNRYLRDTSALFSAKWADRELNNSDGLPVLDWTGPNITVSTNLAVAGGVTASTFNAVGSAYQMNGITVIDSNRNIVSGGSVTASAFFGDASNLTNVTSAILGMTNNYILKDSQNATSVNWEQRYLYSTTGVDISVDWGSKQLFDTGGMSSLRWNDRALDDSTGNTVLGWEDSGGVYTTGVLRVGNGTTTVYYCTGSTAGAFDGNLARDNTNAGACSGGTWVATSLKVD